MIVIYRQEATFDEHADANLASTTSSSGRNPVICKHVSEAAQNG